MGPLERPFSDIASEVAPNRVDPSSSSAPVSSGQSTHAIAPAVVGLISTAISALASGGIAWYQNRMNRKNYEQQVQDNIAQWERENAYNSPSAMMSRFKAAGLNPDLIYGQQNESGHTQVAPEAPQSPNLAGIFSTVSQMRLATEQQEAQIDLLRSEAERNRSQVAHDSADIAQKWKQLELQDASLAETIRRNKVLDGLDDARKSQILDAILTQEKEREKITQDIIESVSRVNLNDAKKDLTEAQRFLTDAQTGYVNKQSKWYDSSMFAQIELMRSQKKVNEQQASLLEKQCATYFRRFYAELDEIFSRTRENNAQATMSVLNYQLHYREVIALVEKYQKEMSRWYVDNFLANKSANGNFIETNLANMFLSGKWMISAVGGFIHS